MINDDENNSVVDEVLEQYEQDLEENNNETVNWAVQRIEEANLFKYLLSTPIFAENSADPAIVASVNAKVARFAMNELKELLGGKKEEEVVKVESPFSPEETFALKTLAAKVIEKTGGQAPTAERTPTMNSIEVNNTRQIATNQIKTSTGPKMNNVGPSRPANIPAPPQTKKVVKPVKSTKGMSPEEKRKHDLVEKNSKKVTPTSPITPIPQPVNGSWATSHARAGAAQSGDAKGGKDILGSIIGLELASPAQTGGSSSGGEGVDSAIEFDPDQQ